MRRRLFILGIWIKGRVMIRAESALSLATLPHYLFVGLRITGCGKVGGAAIHIRYFAIQAVVDCSREWCEFANKMTV